jgi:hypothetical protein
MHLLYHFYPYLIDQDCTGRTIFEFISLYLSLSRSGNGIGSQISSILSPSESLPVLAVHKHQHLRLYIKHLP